MEMAQFFTGVANYGFPMIVSWYLLVRTESKLDKLNANIDALTHTINSILK